MLNRVPLKRSLGAFKGTIEDLEGFRVLGF